MAGDSGEVWSQAMQKQSHWAMLSRPRNIPPGFAIQVPHVTGPGDEDTPSGQKHLWDFLRIKGPLEPQA